ncbi:hypothetical protein AB9P05_13260 [Roseivirga sp. BDSF3-8]|uniref:hypothetical protein n=1 Tax=Roseivirga sp. BDSF3-8 TaxID=3241598 RepID=UPI003531A370
MKKKIALDKLSVSSFVTQDVTLVKGGVTGTCKTNGIETCEPCTGWWCPSNPEQC